MLIEIAAAERAVLERAMRGARRVRDWRRYQAVLLLAAGQTPAQVATAVRASRSSVYNWAAAWRQEGAAGLHEGVHGGRKRAFDAVGAQWLDQTLASDPAAQGYQVPGWTVPLLRQVAAQRGYRLSAQTLRRTIHRLGWRWKRPKYVLGRPDPAYAEKKPRSLSRSR